jgi:hypothetical protein
MQKSNRQGSAFEEAYTVELSMDTAEELLVDSRLKNRKLGLFLASTLARC